MCKKLKMKLNKRTLLKNYQNNKNIKKNPVRIKKNLNFIIHF